MQSNCSVVRSFCVGKYFQFSFALNGLLPIGSNMKPPSALYTFSSVCWSRTAELTRGCPSHDLPLSPVVIKTWASLRRTEWNPLTKLGVSNVTLDKHVDVECVYFVRHCAGKLGLPGPFLETDRYINCPVTWKFVLEGHIILGRGRVYVSHIFLCHSAKSVVKIFRSDFWRLTPMSS